MPTTTAHEIITRAATYGVKASLWEKGDKARIYAKADRRDIAAYLELDLDEDGNIIGAAFKVFCNTPSQPFAYIKKTADEYRSRLMPLMWAYVIARYGETPTPAETGYGESIAGMIAEARAYHAGRDLPAHDPDE